MVEKLDEELMIILPLQNTVTGELDQCTDTAISRCVNVLAKNNRNQRLVSWGEIDELTSVKPEDVYLVGHANYQQDQWQLLLMDSDHWLLAEEVGAKLGLLIKKMTDSFYESNGQGRQLNALKVYLLAFYAGNSKVISILADSIARVLSERYTMNNKIFVNCTEFKVSSFGSPQLSGLPLNLFALSNRVMLYHHYLFSLKEDNEEDRIKYHVLSQGVREQLLMVGQNRSSKKTSKRDLIARLGWSGKLVELYEDHESEQIITNLLYYLGYFKQQLNLHDGTVTECLPDRALLNQHQISALSTIQGKLNSLGILEKMFNKVKFAEAFEEEFGSSLLELAEKLPKIVLSSADVRDDEQYRGDLSSSFS